MKKKIHLLAGIERKPQSRVKRFLSNFFIRTVSFFVLILCFSSPVFTQYQISPAVISRAVISATATGDANKTSVHAGLLINHYAARNFIEGSITHTHLDQIFQAGYRTPVTGNRQPWHITVVQNQTLARQIIPQNIDGNVLFIVSANGNGRVSNGQILDYAPAVQSIYLAAQALGYGSRIYTAHIDTINSSFKESLSLPAGHNAVALIRVGRVQNVDALSAASARKVAEEITIYK